MKFMVKVRSVEESRSPEVDTLLKPKLTGLQTLGSSLCSPGPMFPGFYVPRFSKKRVLCSPVAIHTEEHRTLFGKSGEHRTLFWEKGPMFPAIYQSLKIFKL